MMVRKSNTYIPRETEKEIKKWLNEREILAITGPRQTGKTTLLKKLKKELRKPVVYADFEDSAKLMDFLKSPQSFIEMSLSKNQRTFFLFDEFQYVPKAGHLLKLLYDQFPQAKFIITGSSSLQIRTIASYLVGRVIFFSLYPLSFEEYLLAKNQELFPFRLKYHQIWQDFLEGKKVAKLPSFMRTNEFLEIVEEYLTFGGYPGVKKLALFKKTKKLNSLVETYIEKDITGYFHMEKPWELRRFANFLSLQNGGILSLSSAMSELGLSYHDIKKFLDILRKTFVIKEITPFSGRRVTEIKKAPRVYFFDLGIRNALINDFRPLELRPDRGALAENFVWQNLFFRRSEEIQYWRTKQGGEVDFILRREAGEIFPVEVKYQSFQKPEVPSGLQSFLKIYAPKRAAVITKDYLGQTKFQQTEILFFPLAGL